MNEEKLKMKEKIIQALKYDLNISEFAGESLNDYLSRLIFSAGASWVRSIVSDETLSNISSPDFEPIYGTNKIHVSEQLKKIILGLIKALEYDVHNTLSDKELSENIKNSIIEKMIKNYEISSESGRLLTTPVQRLKFHNKSLIIGGNFTKSNDTLIFTGAGKWDISNETDKSYHELWDIPNDYKTYINSIINNAPFQEIESLNDIKIYKYRNGAYGLSERYWNKYNKKLSYGIYVGKDTYDIYYLIYIANNSIQITKLNEWYKSTKNILRIIYASAKENGFSPCINIHRNYDYIELFLYCALPAPEERIVQLSSWEKTDKNGFIIRMIPVEIWNEISEIFSNLGINIKEI